METFRVFETYYQTDIQEGRTNLHPPPPCNVRECYFSISLPILGLFFFEIQFAEGKNAFGYICLSLVTNETHVVFHGFIHLNFFYEFPMYVLSQLVLAPSGCFI